MYIALTYTSYYTHALFSGAPFFANDIQVYAGRFLVSSFLCLRDMFGTNINATFTLS